MRIVHVCAGLDGNNGMANTAREFVAEERAAGDDASLTNDLAAIAPGVDSVYLHGAWLPLLWRAARRTKDVGARLVVRPAGSYDPVRLAYHGWKKRLAAPFERRMLSRADIVLATCRAEADWIRAYAPAAKVELTDLRRFFDLRGDAPPAPVRRPLRLLYLGRRHPLKGLAWLEEAVQGMDVELRVASAAFGDEKERLWDWCDALVLPTLSENFGRVVAEALAHGKRAITTDGAPAWAEGVARRDLSPEGLQSGYGRRLVYLTGYRAGTDAARVRLLKSAIEEVIHDAS